jgi:hypothetical protein
MRGPLNKITGANAGGPPQLPIRTRWAARVAQFGRSMESFDGIVTMRWNRYHDPGRNR